jgi:hypothetical protein
MYRIGYTAYLAIVPWTAYIQSSRANKPNMHSDYSVLKPIYRRSPPCRLFILSPAQMPRHAAPDIAEPNHLGALPRFTCLHAWLMATWGRTSSSVHRPDITTKQPTDGRTIHRVPVTALVYPSLLRSPPCSGGTDSTPPRPLRLCSIASILMTRRDTTMRPPVRGRWMMDSRRVVGPDRVGHRRWRSCWRSRSC